MQAFDEDVRRPAGVNLVPTPRIVAFVMAGGEGTRLRPLTYQMPKPALPLAGRHRIIDFVLSNLYNSGVRSIFTLLQYKPQPLVDHLIDTWGFVGDRPGEFVEVALPRETFRGTSDAVYKSLDLLDRARADLVAVFAADHVYRMDVRQMLAFHMVCDADVTVAAVRVPIEEASQFGVICTDRDARITAFQEKPTHPQPTSDDASRAYVSMGNYLFRPHVLRAAVRAAARRGEHDFGRHVLPRIVQEHAVYAYDFRCNEVPGLQPFEEPAYWRDVGTLEAYLEAQQDAQGPTPRLSLDNPSWPIHCVGAAPFSSHARAAAPLPMPDALLGARPQGGSIAAHVQHRDA